MGKKRDWGVNMMLLRELREYNGVEGAGFTWWNRLSGLAMLLDISVVCKDISFRA